MVPQPIINIQVLVSGEQCYKTVRGLRWPDGTKCPHCHSKHIIKRGHDETQPARQKYECKGCGKRFDDLTGTVFAGHHQPLKIWILCLYFMGLNLSNQQISQELDLNPSDVHQMTTQLREGVEVKQPEVKLTGEVECDEVYVIAGHKGNPDAVKKKGRKGRRNRLKGARGRGTLEKEKPPILGMIQRSGEVVIQMLANVQQTTIAPLIQSTIVPGTLVFTDEYNIYNRLPLWGYEHKTVNHSLGE